MVGEQEGRRLPSGEQVQGRQCQTLGQAKAGSRYGSVAPERMRVPATGLLQAIRQCRANQSAPAQR